MNLDLLIKLVKLANNNPNDNEANLAARKVCKMIAEGNYKFNNVIVKERPKVTVASNPYGTNDWVNDYFKRQEEFFRNRKKPEEPKWNPTEKQEEFYKKQWKDVDFGFDPFSSLKYDAKSRACSKCGHVFQTFNKQEPFVCFACPK